MLKFGLVFFSYNTNLLEIFKKINNFLCQQRHDSQCKLGTARAVLDGAVYNITCTVQIAARTAKHA